MNLVILTGRLTRDPELKFGQSGKAYSRFSLAVDRPFQKGEADFINCVVFGKTAELIGEYLRKGRKVGVQGRIQMNRYEVNGEKRTSYDVLVDTVEFLESKNGTGEDSSYSSGNYNEGFQRAAEPVKSAPVGNDFEDDEFPF